ncbi:hypothetical protein MXD81_48960 [Microbacteriaceae bacterium K1510]|nr:hypothetical protein [Microbacteriaceae bacterium K1510]
MHDTPKKTRRADVYGSTATMPARDGRSPTDPMRDLVMAYVSRLVANGIAEWQQIESGDIRLRFQTGETFIFSDWAVVRIA